MIRKPVRLTKIQSTVLRRVAQGVPAKVVGAELGCRQSTVASHLSAVALKYGADKTKSVSIVLAHLRSLDADARQRFLDDVLGPPR